MNYLIYFGIGLLGLLLQVGIKMQSFKTRCEALKVNFFPSEYFKSDWLSIVIAFIALLMWLSFVPDIAKNYPKADNWFRIMFGFVGYGGTSLSTWAFSQFDSYIKKASAYKADIAATATGTEGMSTPLKANSPVKTDSSPKI